MKSLAHANALRPVKYFVVHNTHCSRDLIGKVI
jgi:hypothetical protein